MVSRTLSWFKEKYENDRMMNLLSYLKKVNENQFYWF